MLGDFKRFWEISEDFNGYAARKVEMFAGCYLVFECPRVLPLAEAAGRPAARGRLGNTAPFINSVGRGGRGGLVIIETYAENERENGPLPQVTNTSEQRDGKPIYRPPGRKQINMDA